MDTEYRNKWPILAAVSLALFMATIDGTIVNVALPTLVADFQTDFPTIQWVVLAFLLGLSVLMLSVGRLADMLGKRRIFMLGLVIFTAGSALCGLSPTVYALIAARLVQSIGAAMLLALGVAIVTETWPPQERGKALGVSAGVISLGVVIGPSVGGIIISALSWHWIFFVNVPLGLLALAATWRYVPAQKPKSEREKFDFLGAGVLAVGLLALLLALTVGQTAGFGEPGILALFGVAAVGLVLFVLIERRVRFPMLDLNLFRNTQFSLNLATGALTFVAISAVVFLLPFYLELVLGLSVLQVGLLMGVAPLLLAILGPLAGSLSDRYGTRPVSVVGLTALVVGYLFASTMDTDTTPGGYVLRMLLVGVGMGVFQSPNNSAIMGAAPRHRLGIASSMLSITRTLGQTVGIALLGALFAVLLTFYAGQPTDISVAAPADIASALQNEFLLAAALVGFGLILSLFDWRRERRRARMAAAVQVDSV